MTACIEIDNANFGAIDCGTSSCLSGFLIPPETTNPLVRKIIAKSDIKDYEPIETATSFDIVFTRQDGSIITWSFTNNLDRDAALANVNIAMGAQQM